MQFTENLSLSKTFSECYIYDINPTFEKKEQYWCDTVECKHYNGCCILYSESGRKVKYRH